MHEARRHLRLAKRTRKLAIIFDMSGGRRLISPRSSRIAPERHAAEAEVNLIDAVSSIQP